MSQTPQQKNKPVIVVALADENDVTSLNERIPACDWVHAPGQWPIEQTQWPCPSRPDAVLVSAAHAAEDTVVRACERIREHRQLSQVPMFALISMYQLHVGNAVRRMNNAHYLISPIREEVLYQKIDEFGPSR